MSGITNNLKPNRGFFCSSDLRLSYQYYDHRRKNPCGCYCNDGQPSIILIHSISFDSNYWLCLMAKLCPTSNVFAIDLPCSGESEWTDNPEKLSIKSLTKMISDLVTELDLESVYLVGQSLGGVIAIQFTVDYPSLVKKLIVSGTTPKLFNIDGSDWPYPCTPEFQNYLLLAVSTTDACKLHKYAVILNDLVDPVCCNGKELLVEQYIDMVDQIRNYIPMLETIDIRNILPQVSVPTLVMNGTEDPISVRGAAQYLANAIPNSALVEYYDQGSNIAILNTSLYNKNVLNFFFVRCDPCCALLQTICVKPKYDCNTCCENDDGDDCDNCDNNDTDHHCYYRCRTNNDESRCRIKIPCRYTE